MTDSLFMLTGMFGGLLLGFLLRWVYMLGGLGED